MSILPAALASFDIRYSISNIFNVLHCLAFRLAAAGGGGASGNCSAEGRRRARGRREGQPRAGHRRARGQVQGGDRVRGRLEVSFKVTDIWSEEATEG